jgi:hypothetical protein
MLLILSDPILASLLVFFRNLIACAEIIKINISPGLFRCIIKKAKFITGKYGKAKPH